MMIFIPSVSQGNQNLYRCFLLCFARSLYHAWLRTRSSYCKVFSQSYRIYDTLIIFVHNNNNNIIVNYWEARRMSEELEFCCWPLIWHPTCNLSDGRAVPRQNYIIGKFGLCRSGKIHSEISPIPLLIYRCQQVQNLTSIFDSSRLCSTPAVSKQIEQLIGNLKRVLKLKRFARKFFILPILTLIFYREEVRNLTSKVRSGF